MLIVAWSLLSWLVVVLPATWLPFPGSLRSDSVNGRLVVNHFELFLTKLIISGNFQIFLQFKSEPSFMRFSQIFDDLTPKAIL